jgi:predicted house-cleaning NTP pyrophosphatase (Maf/HAM1 superfamily)
VVEILKSRDDFNEIKDKTLILSGDTVACRGAIILEKAANDFDVAKYLSDKGINFDKQKTVKLIDALYSLMIKNKNKKITTAIDEGMIEWIIDNIS